MRVAEINRVTNETDVQLWLDLDGVEVNVASPFLS